jgi:predicted ATPase
MQRDKQYVYSLDIKKSSEDVYPFNLPVISNFTKIKLHKRVTFLIGDNGSGKSTIMEAVAIRIGLNPEGGTKNTRFETHNTVSSLYANVVLETGNRIKHSFFFRSETVYNLFSKAEKEKAEDPRYGWHVHGWSGRHEASHGEGHFGLMLDKMNDGFYLLDEPESALSIKKQMSFITLIHDLSSKGAQFIISTHSPIILSYPNAYIYSLSEKGPHKVNYEETDPFKSMEMFMRNRKTIISELTKD